MIRLFCLLSCLLIAFCSHCAYAPFSTVNSQMVMEDARVIAVLNFEQDGFMAGEKIGGFAADELTSALFLNRKAKVVDRSNVRAVLSKNEVTQPAFESKDIEQIGRLLDTDFIILGKIIRLSGDTPIPEDNPRMMIQIVFRILAVRNGTLIGVVENKKTCSHEIQQCIQQMIREMAERVDIRG